MQKGEAYEQIWRSLGVYTEKRLQAATLTFEEIGRISGTPLDHSFLQHKKELTALGYEVKKISPKARTVLFEKILIYKNINRAAYRNNKA